MRNKKVTCDEIYNSLCRELKYHLSVADNILRMMGNEISLEGVSATEYSPYLKQKVEGLIIQIADEASIKKCKG